MSKKINFQYFLLVGFIALCLMTMLSYPSGYDHSVFFLGGQMIISKGAIPYRDFIDTKPPIIFYIYGASQFLFQNTEWSYRAFDILFQAISIFFLFEFIKKNFENIQLAYLTILTYTILYVSSGYYMTAQAESFTILPGIAIWQQLINIHRQVGISKRKLIGAVLLIAFCLTFLLLLKFTLFIFIVGIAGYIFFHSRLSLSNKFIFFTVITFGTAFFVSLYLFQLYFAGGLASFIEGVEWVSGYANLTPLLDIGTIRQQYFLAFPQIFVSSYSAVFFIFLVLGIYFAISKNKLPLLSHLVNGNSIFHSISLWLLFSGLLSVLYERKCLTYHYSRTFFLASPYIGAVLLASLSLIKDRWIQMRGSLILSMWVKIKSYAFFCVIFIPTVFFSPFTRLLSHPLEWTIISLSNDEEEKLKRFDFDNYYGTQRKLLKDYFSGKLSQNGNIFIWGNFIELYSILGKTPNTICLTNTPFVTRWTPKVWKDKLLSQLQTDKPSFFIVETNDSRPTINGETGDSYTLLKKWQELFQFLSSNYTEAEKVGNFMIFRRNALAY